MQFDREFSLEKYAYNKRYTCPRCGRGRCFSRYVDQYGKYLSSVVGRCDHETSCGYHYTPRKYFADHPEARPTGDLFTSTAPRRPQLRQEPPRELCQIPEDLARRTVKGLSYQGGRSDFVTFLLTLFPEAVVQRLVEEYRLGMTRAHDVIFWQFDTLGRCRTGKVMKINPVTGKRVKDAAVPGRVDWVHSRLKKQGELRADWTVTQCLFGEHLLGKYTDKEVHIVESEKTAVICAATMPHYLWLSCGGKSNLGTVEREADALRGRRVVLYPDVDGFELWTTRAARLRGVLNVTVSDYIEKRATPADRLNKIDLADLIIAARRRDPGRAVTTETEAPGSDTDLDAATVDAIRHLCEGGADVEKLTAFAVDFGLMATSFIQPNNYFVTR